MNNTINILLSLDNLDNISELQKYQKKGYIINSISKQDNNITINLISKKNLDVSQNIELLKWIDYFHNILILEIDRKDFTHVLQKKIHIYYLLQKHYKELYYAFILTPREMFVPIHLYNQSYDNNPLSIAHKQTISQPSLVADMISNMKLNEWKPSQPIKIYEIGTCTGYSAMWTCRTLTELGIQYTLDSIEYIPELIELANKNLRNLPFEFKTKDDRDDILKGQTIHQVYSFQDMRDNNSELRIYAGDGIIDYQQNYDRIICTAGAHNIPIPFLTQLNINGISITSTKPNKTDGKLYGEKMLHITKIKKIDHSNNVLIESEIDFHAFIQSIVQDSLFYGKKPEMEGYFNCLFIDMQFHYHATCCMRFVPLIGSEQLHM